MIVGLPAWRLLAPRGGVGNTLYHLLAQYAELAPSDAFVVYHDGTNPDLPPSANLRARPLRAWPLENNLTWNDWALPRAIARDRPDLVHNVSYTLPAGLRAPAVVTVHDVSYKRHPEWFSPKARTWLDRGTRRAVAGATIVTDSAFSAAEIEALYGLPRERITVVPLAAEPRFRVLDADTVAEARERLGLPERFLLYLGGPLLRRRLDRVVTACAEVLPQVDAHLVVAGPARGEVDVAAEAERCGLADRVRLLGYVPHEDLPALYNAATAFAWPSIYEGFGLPALEALACGTPTVVADAGSLPEVVGEAALRVPDEQAALTEALARLLTDTALRERLHAAGPAQAARFSWRATAEAMLAVYRRVLGDER